jgi:hypothetical protein
MNDIVEINGEKYQKISPNGHRAVIVLDRGWIYAGDVEEKNGRIYLTRVTWVFNWSSIGFNKMIEEPNNSKVNLQSHADINFPADVEIFRVPVGDDWGVA